MECNCILFREEITNIKRKMISYRDLEHKFGKFYLVPEGGDNALGQKGCEEILPEENDFDLFFAACGTATTFKGIQNR